MENKDKYKLGINSTSLKMGGDKCTRRRLGQSPVDYYLSTVPLITRRQARLFRAGWLWGNTFYLFGYDDNESEQLLPADAVGLG